MSRMKPKVSIVLCVYNGGKTLPLCLDSLMKLDFPKEDIEIIAVDNNSTDSTKDTIRQYPVKYAFEKKRGRAAARNKGIKESSGELIAFIDADCVADRLWLKNIITGFTNELIAGCGGDYLSYNAQTMVEKYYDFKDFLSQKKRLVTMKLLLPIIATYNAVYRRDALEEVGLFDNSFITTEDVDLSWRLSFGGYQLNYVPEAIVYHKHPDRLTVFCRKWFEYGVNTSYLVQKYSNLIKWNSVIHNDWIRLLFRPLQSIGIFPKTLFTGKSAIEKVYPFFDIIGDTAWFLGKLYGLMRIKLGIEKIVPLSIPEDKIPWRMVDEKVVIPEFKGGFNYVLNDLGSRIWVLHMEGKQIPEIIDTIADEYAVDRQESRNDVTSFISELKKEGLLKEN